MARPLSELLEMEFNLRYYLHVNDFDGMDRAEINWFYGRLVEQKKKEAEAREGKKDDFRQTIA